jgi:radical SAM superfamily enzyme YgiQ (UPF0313 family)
MPLKIYLADLTHMGQGVATEAFPLNLGLVASYVKKTFSKDVNVTLFKYPQDLHESMQESPPDVLACSNYVWNCNLSYHFVQLAKSLNPEALTVFGGTNYPFDAAPQEEFLRKHPDVDTHIFYEGEIAFSNIIKSVLSAASPIQALKSPIDGCQFISPEDSSFVSGNPIPRITNLDSIPSPYTTGILDKFFDGALTPMMETTRGCPFACNFCNAGEDYFNKINKFSDEYVREEIFYVAKKATQADVSHLTLTDNNFGMIPRDAITTRLVHECQKKYGWPLSLSIWTGKNAKERVIAATELLGDSLNLSMSVQSMDETVLKNIERDNIRLEDYRAIAESLDKAGRPQYAEIIMPLPGETLQTHLNGLDDLLDTRLSRITSLTITMLHGTPYKDDKKFLDKYGYVNKFRLVPLDFSEIDGQHLFDVEEVGIATHDMSFEEYVDARAYLYVIDLCFNSGIFKPLQRYLIQQKIKISDWIRNIYNNLEKFPEEPKKIIQSFRNETIGELWESEEKLVKYFSEPENYQALINGERGGNVLFKHRVWMYSEMAQPWINAVFSCTQDLIQHRNQNNFSAAVENELKALRDFISATTKNCYSPELLNSVINEKISYNILKWMKSDEDSLLENFATKDPILYAFYFTNQDIRILSDGFNRYGSNLAGFIKLIQRCSGKIPGRSVIEETAI